MSTRWSVLAVGLLACTLLGWQVLGADRIGRRSFEAREAARLRRHFAVVERELLGRDVSGLSPAQRAARAEQVRLLRRYAAEGRFPRNEYLPSQVPFFRDIRGNLCAMAFLIAASGRGDIVDHVARTRNNAYVPALADEPGLAAWLDRHGLTLAEAARIQPSYPGYGDQGVKPSAEYVGATVVFGGLSSVSMLWNGRSMDRLVGHQSRAFLGLGAGALNVGMGLMYVGKEESSRQALGVVNLAVGAGAMILGARALSAKRHAQIAGSARLRLTPVVTGGTTLRFGFAGHLRF